MLPPDTNVFFSSSTSRPDVWVLCLRANNFSGIMSELSIVSVVKLKSLLSTLAIIFNFFQYDFVRKIRGHEKFLLVIKISSGPLSGINNDLSLMSINPEYKNVGTFVKCSFDHVCLYEEELRTSESIGQVQTRTEKSYFESG